MYRIEDFTFHYDLNYQEESKENQALDWDIYPTVAIELYIYTRRKDSFQKLINALKNNLKDPVRVVDASWSYKKPHCIRIIAPSTQTKMPEIAKVYINEHD